MPVTAILKTVIAEDCLWLPIQFPVFVCFVVVWQLNFFERVLESAANIGADGSLSLPKNARDDRRCACAAVGV